MKKNQKMFKRIDFWDWTKLIHYIRKNNYKSSQTMGKVYYKQTTFHKDLATGTISIQMTSRQTAF